ncbi:MAG: hypothetical protein OEU26_34780, partial [Candidatus Tectomicrobia bacterium]|nr:hypothetical protein [Candidatus Tectomicrobia bacterium]
QRGAKLAGWRLSGESRGDVNHESRVLHRSPWWWKQERDPVPGSMLTDMITILTALTMIAFLWLR